MDKDRFVGISAFTVPAKTKNKLFNIKAVIIPLRDFFFILLIP
ncbi:hypothetical protein ES707_06977 [subsurface metagenome]